MSKLLNRDDFREGVFERDHHKCVICGEPAQDAHHIIERRLFDDGGYYLDNGSSLCGKHHIEAEMTTLHCDDIRKGCGIENIILPEHFYADQEYDKWGNPIINNNVRLKGDLFFDESVQKIQKQGNMLDLFSKYIKYPRTFFVPWGDKTTFVTNEDINTRQNCTEFSNRIRTEPYEVSTIKIYFYEDYLESGELKRIESEIIKPFTLSVKGKCWGSFC